MLVVLSLEKKEGGDALLFRSSYMRLVFCFIGLLCLVFMVSCSPDTPGGVIPVEQISISSDVAYVVEGGETLQLHAVVTPSNATDSLVTWSVTPDTGIASIDQNGLLTAGDVGNVIVRVAAHDDSGVFGGEKTIQIVTVIQGAIRLVEEAQYSASQAEVENMGEAEAKANTLVQELLENNVEVIIEITTEEFTAPVAGDADDPNGSPGAYSFTVMVRAGEDVGETATLTMTISATPYTVPEQTIWEGTLSENTTWSGEVQVNNVTVPEGVTLSIEPGTIVKFKSDRGYIDLDKGGLQVAGGTLIAEGTPQLSRFSSLLITSEKDIHMPSTEIGLVFP